MPPAPPLGTVRRMRRAQISSLFLSGLALALLLAGCSTREIRRPSYDDEPGGEAPPTTDNEPPPAPRITEEPFVWTVAKDGKTSHIMGTIHVGVTLDEALPPALQDEAANARVLMLEIDPSDMDPATLLAAARLPEGERQDALYPPRVWHEIANQLNTTMNEQTLRTMRPWFTMLMLLQALVGRMHEGAPPEGMDMTLFRMATETDVTLRPLETVQAQVDALASPPDAEVARMVTDMIEGMQRGENELEVLLEAYRSADLARIGMILLDPDERELAPEFHAALIDRRNEAWMAPLQRELEQGDAFVAVGLGHLVGPEGILARLRAVGYTVERAR